MFSLFPDVAHLMVDLDLPGRDPHEAATRRPDARLARARRSLGRRLIAFGAVLAAEDRLADQRLRDRSLAL